LLKTIKATFEYSLGLNFETFGTMRTILLIDDDKDDQYVFKDALRAIDSRLVCDVAPNGRIALEMLAENRDLPYLAFLDLNMPVMDGYEFLRHARKSERLKALPIGIVSTSSILADMKTTKALGARFFLTKPNDFRSLCDKLHQILAADHTRGEYLIVI
jgi:CheY-like chemotaxis protein